MVSIITNSKHSIYHTLCSAGEHAYQLCCKFWVVSIITIHFESEFLIDTIECLELFVTMITSGKLGVVSIFTISFLVYWAVNCVFVTSGQYIYHFFPNPIFYGYNTVPKNNCVMMISV
jgi:hypothetical protein